MADSSSLVIWAPPSAWQVYRPRLAETAAPVAAVAVSGWVLLLWLLFALGLLRALLLVGRLFVVCCLRALGLALEFAVSPFWAIFVMVSLPLRGTGSHVEALEVCPGDTRVDRDGCPRDEPQVEGAGVGSQRHAQLSSHLVCGRLRRRARWARRLELVLGVPHGRLGQLVRGRWTPDLPSAGYSPGLNVLLTQFEDGCKILGGGSISRLDKDGVVTGSEPYYHVELSDGSRDVVFPGLLSKLCAFAFLRERNATLVSALRLRALEWCKEAGFSSPVTYLSLPGALRAAWTVSSRALACQEALERSGPGPSLWWSSA